MPNRETDLAWAAGFFDGDGCVGFNKTRAHYKSLCIGIVQVNKEPLERFLTVVDAGYINGPYEKPGNPVWQYQIRKVDDIMNVKNLLWPYLTHVKHEQFTKAINSYEEYKDSLPPYYRTTVPKDFVLPSDILEQLTGGNNGRR